MTEIERRAVREAEMLEAEHLQLSEQMQLLVMRMEGNSKARSSVARILGLDEPEVSEVLSSSVNPASPPVLPPPAAGPAALPSAPPPPPPPPVPWQHKPSTNGHPEPEEDAEEDVDEDGWQTPAGRRFAAKGASRARVVEVIKRRTLAGLETRISDLDTEISGMTASAIQQQVYQLAKKEDSGVVRSGPGLFKWQDPSGPGGPIAPPPPPAAPWKPPSPPKTLEIKEEGGALVVVRHDRPPPCCARCAGDVKDGKCVKCGCDKLM